MHSETNLEDVMIEVQQLEREIRELLAKMELLSEAKSANVDASPGKQKPGSKHLTHNGPVLHMLWVKRFEDHWDDPDALQRLLRAGTAALELRRHGPPKIHDVVESEDWILSYYEGIDAHEVAMIESERGAHCSPSYVLHLRRANDRTDVGYQKPPSEGRRRALDRLLMEHPKKTHEFYAKQLGVSRSWVTKLLNDRRWAA